MIRRNSFTLIELLMGVSILVILSAATIPMFRSILSTPQVLTLAAENLRSDLRLAQSKALAGIAGSTGEGYWGVWVVCSGGVATSYKLGEPSSDDPSAGINPATSREVKLLSGIKMDCTSDFQIVFGKLTGKMAYSTSNPATITLRDNYRRVKRVTVTKEGLIKID